MSLSKFDGRAGLDCIWDVFGARFLKPSCNLPLSIPCVCVSIIHIAIVVFLVGNPSGKLLLLAVAKRRLPRLPTRTKQTNKQTNKQTTFSLHVRTSRFLKPSGNLPLSLPCVCVSIIHIAMVVFLVGNTSGKLLLQAGSIHLQQMAAIAVLLGRLYRY